MRNLVEFANIHSRAFDSDAEYKNSIKIVYKIIKYEYTWTKILFEPIRKYTYLRYHRIKLYRLPQTQPNSFTYRVDWWATDKYRIDWSELADKIKMLQHKKLVSKSNNNL